ncbi:hypothetical protein KIK06_19255 [Nocardiopsis sp. EMB25]|uniref:hypothetical protein n=1 Tax=Nocardiopsis TaxID=2013 RepID=UPI0003494314|nr:MULTISPECIES: hypothetical protein [Nocardiopsis]MCY9786032.1 hypothetical protein [Nocardiopsis sp. EMB25]
MIRGLVPHPQSGAVLPRAAAGVASIALAAALTSCSFNIGELEPVGEDATPPAETEETGSEEQSGQTGAAEDGVGEGTNTGAAGEELPVDPAEAVAWDEETFWLSGSGDALYRIDWTPSASTALEFTHTGGANFIVVPYDADGIRFGSLVNEIGAYEGDTVLGDAVLLGDAGGIEFIHIQADGAWTMGR